MRRSALIVVLTLLLVIGMASMAYAASGNLPSPGDGRVDPSAPLNANKTGTDDPGGTPPVSIDKRVSSQNMHTSYQNNTNSCASCHVTHNAAGEALLFNDNQFKVCASCHDGTLGAAPNVFATPATLRAIIDSDPTKTATFVNGADAGTFNGDIAAGNPSAHMANGVTLVNAAPGGNRSSNDASSWGKTFTCASCHSPHGSYSSALLNVNPNNINVTNDDNPVVANQKPTGIKKGYNFVKNGTITISGTTYDKWMAQDPVTPTNYLSGPWLYGYSYASPKYYYTRIWVGDDYNGRKDGSNKAYNDYFAIDFVNGYAIQTSGPDFTGTTLKIDVAPATVVKFAGTPGAYTGYQSGSIDFCGACHTDYAQKTGTASTARGTYDTSHYRHNISKGVKSGMQNEGGNMVCLTCHYAHGTDAQLQRDATDTMVSVTGGVPDQVDVNSSSALKKYINMSVCWKCHQSSHSEVFKNTDYYWSSSPDYFITHQN